MLKVKSDNGKFDIVLDEANLLHASGTEKALKGRSKGVHSKALQPRVSHPSGSKNQVTTVKHAKSNNKRSSSMKGHQRNETMGEISTERVTWVTEDASYLTKTQLSKTFLSLNSENHQSATVEGFEKSIEAHRTSNSEKSEDLVAKISGKETAKLQQGHLSEKNLQWKRELDEQVALKLKLQEQKDMSLKEREFEDYNPWGRPGGGAPIRTQSGKVVADFKEMTKKELMGRSSQTSEVRPRIMTTGETTMKHDVNTDIPLAMRSSFAAGAPGIVQFETDQSKAEEKKKWVQDLEQEIKEKKARKAQEKLLQLSVEPSHEAPAGSLFVAKSGKVGGFPVSVETSAPSTATVVAVAGSRSVNVHARGQGLQNLALVDQDELEKKRLKTLEHQLAIKEQVEEKRRLKQEEKERAIREEADKERLLAQERQRLQMQHEEELKRQRKKEEEAQRRAESTEKSVLKAHESVKHQKTTKWIKYLESVGHEVSGLTSRMRKTTPLSNKSDHGSMHGDSSLPRQIEVRLRDVPLQSSSQSERETATSVSPRIVHGSYEFPNENDRSQGALEEALKDLSLRESLESEWTPSSQAYEVTSPSLHRGEMQSIKKTRLHSEKGQRKKQVPKKAKNKLESTKNTTGQVDHPATLEDAFMLPYRRTSSATFYLKQESPSSNQNITEDISDSTRGKSLPVQTTAHKKQPKNSTKTAASTKKDTTRAKVSKTTKADPKPNSKPTDLPKGRDEKRKVMQDDGKTILLPGKISPEILGTARQEMILKQLAALRQGLMMKERELQFGALS
ncbi:uncharacterized protein LOC141879096 isoform X3 [Acropora palmata]|uniref:uncharacterized protein LOC141879096 isoform X3 n=1 Tax=Acropora palmata TaxID=6131 RepID=UPI003DA1C8F0